MNFIKSILTHKTSKKKKETLRIRHLFSLKETNTHENPRTAKVESDPIRVVILCGWHVPDVLVLGRKHLLLGDQFLSPVKMTSKDYLRFDRFLGGLNCKRRRKKFLREQNDLFSWYKSRSMTFWFVESQMLDFDVSFMMSSGSPAAEALQLLVSYSLFSPRWISHRISSNKFTSKPRRDRNQKKKSYLIYFCAILWYQKKKTEF